LNFIKNILVGLIVISLFAFSIWLLITFIDFFFPFILLCMVVCVTYALGRDTRDSFNTKSKKEDKINRFDKRI
jgi:4-amino-4-deoxy-L-arabinose transferase-like glycosyltransferase